MVVDIDVKKTKTTMIVTGNGRGQDANEQRKLSVVKHVHRGAPFILLLLLLLCGRG